jgi:DDE_Tnp_1-associated
MNYSTLPQPPLKMQETSETAQSLYEALQQLPDPRRKAGQRYRIAVVLSLLCLAKMAGQTSLNRVGAPARGNACHLLWTQTEEHALPDDLQADFRGR